MNCKEGDIARCVKDGPLLGMLFQVSNLHYVETRFGTLPTWDINPKHEFLDGGVQTFLFDMVLRPIRDQPGTDETLLWAPVPKEKVKA